MRMVEIGLYTWMMAYRRTEATMMMALLGVKLSVVTPVLKMLHLRVSFLFIACPCKATQLRSGAVSLPLSLCKIECALLA